MGFFGLIPVQKSDAVKISCQVKIYQDLDGIFQDILTRTIRSHTIITFCKILGQKGLVTCRKMPNFRESQSHFFSVGDHELRSWSKYGNFDHDQFKISFWSWSIRSWSTMILDQRSQNFFWKNRLYGFYFFWAIFKINISEKLSLNYL